jgi:hypothetical protein
VTEPDATSAASARASLKAQRRSRRLFGLGVCVLLGLIAYYAITTQIDDPIHLYLGLLMIVFAVLPSLLWARRGTMQLPVFEIFLLTTANTYALPLLNDRADLRAYPPELLTSCALMVLLFQATIVCTYGAIRGRAGRSPFFTAEILTESMQKYLGAGLVLSTLYTYVNVFHEGLIPGDINSVCRAVFAGIGLVVTFIQARRWGMGLLSTNEQVTFAVLLGTQIVISFSTLFLVDGISSILLCLVGYVAGSRRIPLVLTGLLLVTIAILHNGKSVMRAQYWSESGNHRQVAPSELVPFFTQWVHEGLSVHHEGEQQMTKNLIDRSSLFQILCLVAYYTPDRQPYLDGDTYWDIPGQFVPRFFWPGKPVGHISTYKLAIYYGLQREEDTINTTIGFGMIAEAYANFGFFGVGLLAFALGVFYKTVQVRTADSPLLSSAGLFLIVLMAWSFQTEWPMSLWLSSMFQACVTILGIPVILRQLFS